MNIAFHGNQIGLQSIEVTIYDYANYSEMLLGNKSIIIVKHPENIMDRFKQVFL